MKGCEISFASKTVRYKLYKKLQSLQLLTHHWKNLSIDFVEGFLVSKNWIGKTYNSTLVTVNQLTKIVHYEPFKVIINASWLAKVIIDVIVCHHNLLDSITSNQKLVFTSKLWSFLCYFFNIKK